MLQRLYCFLDDLSKHKRDRDKLMEFYINDRLSKSIEVYYKELYNSLNYLVSKNNIRVLREFNKISGG